MDQGPIHIMGRNCPRSDLDIAYMGYYLTYKDRKPIFAIFNVAHVIADTLR